VGGIDIDPVVCPISTYCPVGSAAAIECPSNTYTEVDGNTMIADCLGTWCEAGTFGTAPDCYDCPVGSYCPEGAEYQIPCPVSTYNDLTAASACIACPEGTETTYEGASSVEQCTDIVCEDGMSGSGLDCVECPAGYYCQWGYEIECAMHEYCPAGSAEATACPDDYQTCETMNVSVDQCIHVSEIY
jgi:hypothetical protein